MSSIRLIGCDTWPEFKTRVISELFPQGIFARGQFLFRGQADAEWPLISSYDRWFDRHGFDESFRISYSDELLRTFEAELASGGSDVPALREERVFVALAQHYGLPTRLLDWSESPYVAAFFGFLGLLDVEQEGDVAIWALSRPAFIWSEGRGVEVVHVSGFTLNRSTFRTLEEYSNHFEGALKGVAALYKFVIPATEARTALADLDVMGINPSRCFSDISGVATTARLRHWLGQTH
jgi:hypothetical protein